MGPTNITELAERAAGLFNRCKQLSTVIDSTENTYTEGLNVFVVRKNQRPYFGLCVGHENIFNDEGEVSQYITGTPNALVRRNGLFFVVIQRRRTDEEIAAILQKNAKLDARSPRVFFTDSQLLICGGHHTIANAGVRFREDVWNYDEETWGASASNDVYHPFVSYNQVQKHLSPEGQSCMNEMARAKGLNLVTASFLPFRSGTVQNGKWWSWNLIAERMDTGPVTVNVQRDDEDEGDDGEGGL